MFPKRNEIISLYCGNLKARFHLREIARLSKLPIKTVFKILKKLEKENIVRSEIEGRHKYFELNLDNIETKFILEETEIHRTLLFLKEYPIFKSFLKEMKIEDCAIIIYGSFAKFMATNKSDLDILIVSERELDLPFYTLPYKIHKIFLRKNEFLKGLEAREPLLMEILANHIVLFNHSFFINILWWYHGRKA